MNVLVTGCGGFLGSEIVRQLLRRGDSVVGVSRRSYPDLVLQGMIPLRGDLTRTGFLGDALTQGGSSSGFQEGTHPIEAVIHTAAVAGVWGPWDHYYQNNVVATENVLSACRTHKIRSLVFTSSPSVTFAGTDQSGVDEREPYPEPHEYLCHYPHTKAIAEKAVLAADRPDEPDGLRTLALRPHLIWGPDDPHLMPRIVSRARSGRLRIVGDGTNRVDTVHVVNAAGAHLDALDALGNRPNLASGRAYFIAQDEPVRCWDWIGQICEIAGVEPPRKSISYASAYRIGGILEALFRLTGRKSEPPMTRFVAAQLAKDHYFNISSAKQRLGYRVRISMAQGFQELRTLRRETDPVKIRAGKE